MKSVMKGMGLLAACLVVAAKAHAYTPTSGTPIAGSKHDFATRIYTGAGGAQLPSQLNHCSICHKMHNPKKMDPLWGRDNPTQDGWYVQTHEVKTALGEGGMIPAADFVNARSGMCMSCHDGVTSISGGVTIDGVVGQSVNFGRDLSNMHNVGRSRSATSGGAPVDQEILDTHDRVDTVDANGGAVVKYYLGCGSCHAMHNSKDNGKLLRYAAASKGGSKTVCMNCHSTK